MLYKAGDSLLVILKDTPSRGATIPLLEPYHQLNSRRSAFADDRR